MKSKHILKLYLDVYSLHYTKPKLADHHYVSSSCFFSVYVEDFVIYVKLMQTSWSLRIREHS